MSINKFFSTPVAVASELFSAGWCNLDCQYCYISKVDRIKDIHKTIIDKIKSGKYLEELKYYFGDELESIGHWGTEPTLTISLFKDFYQKAVEEFPKLKTVSFSSNFMTNPDNIIDFAKSLPRKLNLDIQISIDGPPEITDKNRKLGSTDKIIENVLYVFKHLNDSNRFISAHIKPTAAREDIQYLSSFDNLKYYYDFFEDLFSKLLEFKNIRITNVVDPTVVISSDCSYNKEDGINFYKLYKNQIILKENYKYRFINPPESYIYRRAADKLVSRREFYSKHKMFLCSAGDSCFALGEKPYSLQYCHRCFYSDDELYLKESSLDEGSLCKFGVVNKESSEIDKLKFLIRSRAYNDFGRLVENFTYSSCYALAECGMINNIYKEFDMAKMLNFYRMLIGCYLESLIKSGSMFIPDSNLFILLGNGYGELCTSRLIEEGHI